MPRKETYWRNPEKYREQRKEYYRSHSEYVPRKRRRKDTITSVYTTNNKTFMSTKSKKNNHIVGLDEFEKVLRKYYSKKYVSTKLQKMRQLGQVFICQGYPFMTISNYLQAYQNRKIGKLSPSSLKGQQGLLRIIPYLQKCFPTPKFTIFLNPVDQRGVDILVFHNGTPYAVIELTNYERTTYLNPDDAQRYIKNLNEWALTYPDVSKILIVNYPENVKDNPYWKDGYEAFVSKGIGIKILRK